MNNLTQQSRTLLNHLKRWALVAGLAIAATFGVAGQAQARDVYWNVGVGAPGVAVGFGNTPAYVAPVYYAPPRPVYYAPARPVYYAPQPPRYHGDRYYRDDRRHHRHDRHHGHRHGHGHRH